MKEVKYIILSQYWSDHYKEDTYWCANENGYTSIIANAGIYTEEDKIRMEKCHTEDRCKFIPIDRDILDKGMEQLDNIDKNLFKRKEQIESDYERNYEELQEDISKNNDRYSELCKISKDCGL